MYGLIDDDLVDDDDDDHDDHDDHDHDNDSLLPLKLLEHFNF